MPRCNIWNESFTVYKRKILTEFKISKCYTCIPYHYTSEWTNIPYEAHILSLNSSILPLKIKAAYLSCTVRPYITINLHCFKCQRYGHINTTCIGSVICPRCAEIDHGGRSCENSECCINCKGDNGKGIILPFLPKLGGSVKNKYLLLK